MAKSIIPFLPLFMLLVIVMNVTNAQKACTTNAECRRNSCILNFCRSPSQIGGPCDAANNGDDADCLGGNVCINAQCSLRSDIDEGCDNGDNGDCVDEFVCTSSTCSIGWIPQDAMPESRAFGVAGTIGDSIYLAVGNTAVTSRFQPNVNPQWPTSPSYDNFPIPSSRSFSASAVVGGKLFVMGGSSPATNEVWSFDPSQPPGSSSQWTPLTSMPAPRSTACAASFGTRIYFFAGADASNANTDTVFVFDTTANAGEGSWTTLVGVNLPQALVGCAAAQAGDEYIYITGGNPIFTTTRFDTIYRFRPDGNGGVFDPPDGPVASLNTARTAHSATTINGKVVIAGGFGSAEELTSVEMFDPLTNTVSSLPDMNIPRRSHQASVLGSNLFVFGGTGAGAATSAERLFLPA